MGGSSRPAAGRRKGTRKGTEAVSHSRAVSVEAGIYHDFHTVWIAQIRNTLNAGLLPQGYYAVAEQHAGAHVTEVLTLHTAPLGQEQLPLPPLSGGTAVSEANFRRLSKNAAAGTSDFFTKWVKKLLRAAMSLS